MFDFVELEEDTWFDTYKPIPNHIDPNASFSDGEQGYMFETYGAELDFVKKQEPNRIWTYIDGDNGGTFIVNGMRIVNRIGYLVTTLPFDGNKDYQIQISYEDIYECPTCGMEWEDEAASLHYDKFEDLEKCVGCATIEEIKEIEEMETQHNDNL